MLNPVAVIFGAIKKYFAPLRCAENGVAAMEFALVAPCVIVFVIGVFDISKALILNQQVYNAAHTIPVSASGLAVQPDKTTSLTVTQVQQSMSAIFAEMPWIRSGLETGFRSVTMSSIIFQKVDPSCVALPLIPCSYAPHVAWSVPYTEPANRYANNGSTFQAITRSCMQLNQTAPTAGVASDLTSLRTLNVVNPDPILVVDVHYQYTPVFLNFLTGPIDFWASGYWPVRSIAPSATPDQQYTKYDIANLNNGAGKCAGYS